MGESCQKDAYIPSEGYDLERFAASFGLEWQRARQVADALAAMEDVGFFRSEQDFEEKGRKLIEEWDKGIVFFHPGYVITLDFT